MLKEKVGAQNIIVGNAISLEKIPFIKKWALSAKNPQETMSKLRASSKLYNESLSSEIQELVGCNSELNVQCLDINKILQDIYNNPRTLGLDPQLIEVPVFPWENRFDSVDKTKISELYETAKNRVWWDDSHFTSYVHKLISDSALELFQM
ncbi:hypothetical protein BB560_000913 [Smittium megazygosporum]|uniref:Uncharacterized protein n=1 Tax=Smittium megazygosporum TaxID=133381 RepID=A0A2T9ZJ18_9FUNG|nr:hypothetical protein BB560_007138 [Smittium megazygosporum]PVV04585.1 hypothetical protein BB560_000913 [Smittium megazygosporum]